MSARTVGASDAAVADAIVSNFRELYERVTELERKASQIEDESQTKGYEGQ